MMNLWSWSELMSSSNIHLAHMEVQIFLAKEKTHEGVVMAKQCHGDKVVNIVSGLEDTTNFDALQTENKNIKIGIYTSDCAPIAFSDGNKIGVAHVGWRGLCLGLIEKMLLSFDREKVEVFVGPHLHVFEIKKDSCYESIERVFGDRFFKEVEGIILFNYKEAIASCLPLRAVFDPRSTGEDLTLPSHRGQREEQKIITVVSFKK